MFFTLFSGVPALEPAAHLPSPDGRLRAAGGPVRRPVELPDGVRRSYGAGQTQHEARRRGAPVRRAAR